MSDTVKLIIEIPRNEYEYTCNLTLHDRSIWDNAIRNGIPLDSNDSDRAEAQAYFDGQAYGWEEGRKALIDEVKTEIKRMEYHMIDCDVLVSQEEVLEILDNIGKAESEVTE